MSDLAFDQLYPDVLGAISGGARVNFDVLQCALGVFPNQAFVNQPVETVLLLQNMIDQPLQVRVTLTLPAADKAGNTLVLDTPRHEIVADMSAGEVGVLRIPVIAYPPTQPTTGVPLRVTVAYKAPKGTMMRPRAGGAPPANIPISPYKLQALRDVKFTGTMADGSSDTLETTFDIAAKRLPPTQYSLTARYEPVWTVGEMPRERERVLAKLQDARLVANAMTASTIMWSLIQETDAFFAERDLRLFPGEAKAIGKIMTYTLGEATALENMSLESTRWFGKLCHLLAEDPSLKDMDVGELAAQHLYQTALYDAVLLGFRLVQQRVSDNLGTQEERIAYAENIMSWSAGLREGSIHTIYLPLAMAGVTLSLLVGVTIEHPSVMLRELREAMSQRRVGAKREMADMFKIMDFLMVRAEREAERMSSR